MLVILLLLSVVVGLLIFAADQASDWKWLRYPAIFFVVGYAVLAATSAPWPDGLGLETCETVANPGLGETYTDPETIEVCSDLGATAAPLLLAALVVLLLASPELSEFSVPGLFEVKRRVAKQEAKSAELDNRLTEITAVWAVAGASSVSGVSLTVNNNTVASPTPARPAAERLDVRDKATLVVASRLQQSLLTELDSLLRERSPDLNNLELAVYLWHESEEVLRQVGRSPGDVSEFARGSGATGQAFANLRPVIVTGEAVHSAAYGLTSEQQEHYAAYNIAGAVPVFGGPGESAIGALSAAGALEVLPTSEQERAALRSEWAEAFGIVSPQVSVYLQTFWRV